MPNISMTNGICDTCSKWFCTDNHDLDGMNAIVRNREAVAKWRAKYPEKNRAKVAAWQKANRDKVRAKQRRYYERLRQNGTMPSNGSTGISQIK